MDFNEARDDGVTVESAGPYVNHRTLLQTDNHTSTSSLNFLSAGCCRTNSVKALKENNSYNEM